MSATTKPARSTKRGPRGRRGSTPPATPASDALVLQYLPLAHWAVRRRLARPPKEGTAEYEDALGVAHVALVRAARLYDPAKKIAFNTYAVRLIQQELWVWSRTEGLRGLWWAPKDLHMVSHGSLNAPLEGTEVPLVDVLADPNAPDPTAPAAADGPTFDGLLAGLDNQRYAAALRAVYQEGLTQSETAKRLGISSSRVGQLVEAGLDELRRALAAPGGGA